MDSTKNRRKCCWAKQSLYLTIALSIAPSLLFAKAGPAVESKDVQYFKMLSTVECTGKTQFKNRAETLFAVRKQSLSDDKVRYLLSTSDFDPVGDNTELSQDSGANEFSFIIDKKTKALSVDSEELGLLEMVNNHCVIALTKVTKKNIGKTWKQSFNMPFLDHLFAGELKFTLTAIPLKIKVLGEMIAVRALSEPFAVSSTKGSGVRTIRARINAAYLFDPEMEDVYMSISVFEAKTKRNGSKEKLRHEVATYKTDETGAPPDFRGLGKDFERFVRKLGLTRKGIKVVKESALPQWAQSEGLYAAQVANICAALGCEGASNPVATVCIPAARTIALQSSGRLAAAGQMATVSASLAKSIPAVGAMKIAVAP